MEFSLTQVFDRPVHGREFFEEVIRENLDLGRPDRTEGTINNPLDFGVGKDLKNLPYLRQIARNINHRLLEVQRASQDGRFSQQSLQRLPEPTVTPDGRHTSLFLVRLYQRVLRPGLAAALEPPWKVDVPHPLRDKIQELDAVLERMLRDAHLQN